MIQTFSKMKILHTADWHLGHRLHERSQYEEQKMFLDWIENYIIDNNIDVLLVSGDIYDSGSPSSQSTKLYYDFLRNIIRTSCKHIVITGGNHDSPDALNAPKELLNAFDIKVIGKATKNIENEVFKLAVNDEEVIISAVPYLRDQDIRRAVEGETFDEITDRYKQALINHYDKSAQYCKQIKTDKSPVIAMGHLFAIGGSVSESEQQIYVGTLGHIGADDFPETFDYIALGHLHRPQIVGKKEHIRYSGSPNILSFSEIGYDKKILILTTEGDKLARIEEAVIPPFRVVLRVSGTLKDCIEQLNNIQSNAYQLTPWVDVVLDNESNNTIGFEDIYTATEGLDVEVLKVSLKNQRQTIGIDQLLENTKNIKELTPLEVFEMKCKEQDFDLSENKDILDAFNEALQLALEQD